MGRARESRRGEATDTRQVDVHQDDVGQCRVCDAYALRAVHRSEQLKVRPARQRLADQQQVGRVDFDAEHGALLRAIAVAVEGSGRRELVLVQPPFDGRLRRQLDPEHAADTHRAWHADRATHEFDQVFADDRPDTRALFNPGFLAKLVEPGDRSWMRPSGPRSTFTQQPRGALAMTVSSHAACLVMASGPLFAGGSAERRSADLSTPAYSGWAAGRSH